MGRKLKESILWHSNEKLLFQASVAALSKPKNPAEAEHQALLFNEVGRRLCEPKGSADHIDIKQFLERATPQLEHKVTVSRLFKMHYNLYNIANALRKEHEMEALTFDQVKKITDRSDSQKKGKTYAFCPDINEKRAADEGVERYFPQSNNEDLNELFDKLNCDREVLYELHVNLQDRRWGYGHHFVGKEALEGIKKNGERGFYLYFDGADDQRNNIMKAVIVHGPNDVEAVNITEEAKQNKLVADAVKTLRAHLKNKVMYKNRIDDVELPSAIVKLLASKSSKVQKNMGKYRDSLYQNKLVKTANKGLSKKPIQTHCKRYGKQTRVQILERDRSGLAAKLLRSLAKVALFFGVIGLAGIPFILKAADESEKRKGTSDLFASKSRVLTHALRKTARELKDMPSVKVVKPRAHRR